MGYNATWRRKIEASSNFTSDSYNALTLHYNKFRKQTTLVTYQDNCKIQDKSFTKLLLWILLIRIFFLSLSFFFLFFILFWRIFRHWRWQRCLHRTKLREYIWSSSWLRLFPLLPLYILKNLSARVFEPQRVEKIKEFKVS